MDFQNAADTKHQNKGGNHLIVCKKYNLNNIKTK